MHLAKHKRSLSKFYEHFDSNLYLTHRYKHSDIRSVPPLIPSGFQYLYDSWHIDEWILDLIQANTFYLCYLMCRYVFAMKTY